MVRSMHKIDGVRAVSDAPCRSQRGFALFEVAVVSLLLMLMAVWGVHSMVQRMSDARVQNDAAWALTVRGALQGFMARHETSIAQAHTTTDLPDVADWSDLSIAVLQQQGFLPPGFPESPLPGGAAIRVVRTGMCPSADCRVHAVVHALRPYTHLSTGLADQGLLAQWLMATQGWGAVVQPADPDYLRGPAVHLSNPLGAAHLLLPAGVVAVVLSSAQLATHHFVRVADSRDPDLQGGLSVRGTVLARNDLHVQGGLRLLRTETIGVACAVSGEMAADANQQPIVCREGVWARLGHVRAGGFSINQFYGCFTALGTSTSNPDTGTCSCPEGDAMVQISDSGPVPYPDGRTRGFLCVP